MPRAYCTSCGKVMGNHRFHGKLTCKSCKIRVWRMSSPSATMKRLIDYDEKSGAWH